MVPSRRILSQINTRFANYFSAQITSPHLIIKFVKSHFVPGPNLVAGDVTVDADWSTNATNMAAGLRVGTNPYTGNWVTASNAQVMTSLSSTTTPRQVFGVIVEEQSGNTPLASVLFDEPANVSDNNQFLFVPRVSFELPASAVR